MLFSNVYRHGHVTRTTPRYNIRGFNLYMLNSELQLLALIREIGLGNVDIDKWDHEDRQALLDVRSLFQALFRKGGRAECMV